MTFLRPAWTVLPLLLALSTTTYGAGGCEVSVRTTLKSGKVSKRVFHTRAATPADCEEDATLHTTNFFPPKIAKKEVEYRFGDAPAIRVKGEAE